MAEEGSYASFDLWVTPSGRGYGMRAAGSANQQAAGRFARAAVPPAPAGAFPSPGSRNLRPEGDPASPGAKAFGEQLFQLVFRGEVGRLFQESRVRAEARSLPLRLRLHLEKVPELARLPWEYLYDPERRIFLATTPSVSIVRYFDRPVLPRALAVTPPLHVLVVSAAPRDHQPLAAAEELEHIRAALGRLRSPRRTFVEVLESPTFEDLEEKLRNGPCHVLHFIGHGGFQESGTGLLLFEGEGGRSAPVDAPRLATLLAATDIRLVVLNACQGARGSATEMWSGLAQELLHAGIPAVVAMQFEITDRNAVRFARQFYRPLAEGETVDAAVTEARCALFLHGDDLEWGTPVLYTHSPDGDLFEVPPPSLRERLGKDAIRYGWVAALLLVLVGMVGIWIWMHREPPPLVRVVPPDQLAPASPGCPPPPGTDIRFALIPKGTFRMGSRHKEERPDHEVEITRPFCLGQFEVTERQWAQVMTGKTELAPEPLDDRPKTDVSWDQVHEFLGRLNQQAGSTRFRLPTEAEWEYAARAGSTTRYSFGDDPSELPDYGHCRSKAGRDDRGNLAPIGQYKPNKWNLYDMHGNVWEWVEDYYGPYQEGAVQDPKGPAEGTSRVRRGGSYESKVDKCRSAYRDPWPQGNPAHDLGFRIVEDLP